MASTATRANAWMVTPERGVKRHLMISALECPVETAVSATAITSTTPTTVPACGASPQVSLPCLSRQCLVSPQHTGSGSCEELDDCASNPCMNNGTCTDGTDSFTCTCLAEYSGSVCQHSGCTPNPCLNGGECLPQAADSYQCNCTEGYAGKTTGIFSIILLYMQHMQGPTAKKPRDPVMAVIPLTPTIVTQPVSASLDTREKIARYIRYHPD
jgi:Notch-like protein